MKTDIRKHLINAGVRNLKEFGYEHVNSSNIITDMIYAGFFIGMLRDNLGHGFDDDINALIKEVEPNVP